MARLIVFEPRALAEDSRGAAAEEPGQAVADLLGGADADAVEVLALVDEVEQGLAGAGVVERGLRVIDAKPEIEADGVDGHERDARRSFQDGDQVWAGLLEEIDFPFLESGGGSGCAGDREPFEAVDVRDLAAGQAVRGLDQVAVTAGGQFAVTAGGQFAVTAGGQFAVTAGGQFAVTAGGQFAATAGGQFAVTAGGARLVGGVAMVDGVMAGLEFGGVEDVGAGAGGVGDGYGGRGVGETLRHDEQGGRGGADERLGDQCERTGQDQGERAVVVGFKGGCGGHQGLADDVALPPALDAGDGIDAADRGVVVEEEAWAEGEAPNPAILGFVGGVDHLGLGVAVAVEGEKLVVDEEAVIAHEDCRGLDGVEAGQVVDQHDFQRDFGTGGSGGEDAAVQRRRAMKVMRCPRAGRSCLECVAGQTPLQVGYREAARLSSAMRRSRFAWRSR